MYIKTFSEEPMGGFNPKPLFGYATVRICVHAWCNCVYTCTHGAIVCIHARMVQLCVLHALPLRMFVWICIGLL